MKYIINEYQTDSQGNTQIVTPEQRDDYFEGESVFYYKLSFAAVSDLAKHTVQMLDNTGNIILTKCYTAEEKAATRARDQVQQNEPEGGGEG